mmetsp:Transcript_40277/g.126005  ORF Transcript_40277/g.126005 Transcript_40277/m.126005 type:complete len:263 (-) Transcript_40277:110-898(-)
MLTNPKQDQTHARLTSDFSLHSGTRYYLFIIITRLLIRSLGLACLHSLVGARGCLWYLVHERYKTSNSGYPSRLRRAALIGLLVAHGSVQQRRDLRLDELDEHVVPGVGVVREGKDNVLGVEVARHDGNHRVQYNKEAGHDRVGHEMLKLRLLGIRGGGARGRRVDGAETPVRERTPEERGHHEGVQVHHVKEPNHEERQQRQAHAHKVLLRHLGGLLARLQVLLSSRDVLEELLGDLLEGRIGLGLDLLDLGLSHGCSCVA